MEDPINSTDAAERLGVNASRFHRLVAQHGLEPVVTGPGLRGVKFWALADIDNLEALVAQAQATA